MKQKIFIVLFLIILSFSNSQTITVNVKNFNQKPLEDVNIQLLQNDKTIDFKTTDQKGLCTFDISGKDNLKLKVTSIFYKTKWVDIISSNQENVEITLDDQITEIKEVEIKSRPKIATAKEDTISYNIKQIKDGTERTAEDLIKKIPGLEINENGKVTHKGNVIGQVLVDGNELFGKNHKMSTQNITADMLEGIDLWQNYTTISGNSSTALNLKLKNEFKGRITGNIEAHYGNKNSYLLHSNLFKFSKSGNLAFIADANSIAKDPIGIMDFYEMNRQEDIENNDGGKKIETPTFLNNDGKVKSKENQFGALQYSKTAKSFSVTAFSVFNNAQLEKLAALNRQAFEEQPLSYNFHENRFEGNRGFFGTTQVKVKKNFRDNSFLYYNFSFLPTQDNFHQDINRKTSAEDAFFDIKNKVKNNSLNNFLSWNKDLDYSKLIFSFSQNRNNFASFLDINSSEKLFDNSNKSLNQSLNFDSEKYSLDFQLKSKLKSLIFNFHSGYSIQEDDANIAELVNSELEERKLKTDRFTNEIFLQKTIGDFDISGSLSSLFLNFNQFEKHYFEKSFRIKFKPKSSVKTDFGLEYYNKFRSPEFLQLFFNRNYNRNISYQQNAALYPETLVNTNSYKFTFHRFNLDKGNLLFILLLYEKETSNFTTDITNYGLYSQTLYTLGNLNDRWFLVVSDERKIGNYFNLKSKVTGIFNRSNNFINVQSNQTDLRNLEIGQRLSSNFKKVPFQFDLGYTFTQSIFEQSLFDVQSTQKNIKLSLGIRTSISKELIGNVLGEYLIQKAGQNSLNNFLLGGHISYKKEKSLFEYSLMFNNVLNLNSFNYINSSVSLLGTEDSFTTALHGYITGGVKYYF